MNDKLLRRSRARRQLRPAFAKAVRLEAHVTLAEIGEALDVTESTVSRWESGVRKPRGPLAERYAQILSRLEDEVRRG
jgi:transcriptional regulator with XRE-family HTH domain